MSAISRAEFMAKFDEAIAALTAAERVTKEQLRVLSRELLGALVGHPYYDAHLVGDVQFVNRTIVALTPMNRKTAIIYFKEFTGFHFDDSLGEFGEFTKKIQKNKEDHAAKVLKFLEDPMNNIWSWADKNIKVEKKPFSLDKVTQIIEKAREETGGDDAAVIRAVFEGGISFEAVVMVMEEMGREVVEVEAKEVKPDLPALM